MALGRVVVNVEGDEFDKDHYHQRDPCDSEGERKWDSAHEQSVEDQSDTNDYCYE